MTSVTAHFDGTVFVPDEPVSFEPGTSVVVTRAEVVERSASADFLHPVLFPPDPEASQRVLDDPETNLENY